MLPLGSGRPVNTFLMHPAPHLITPLFQSVPSWSHDNEHPLSAGTGHLLPHRAEHHDPVEADGAPFHPGETLDGRFLITEILSRSGMGTIFKAEDKQQVNRLVALKVPHLEYESDPNFFSRFKREERIGLELSHPFVLKFIPVEEKSRPTSLPSI